MGLCEYGMSLEVLYDVMNFWTYLTTLTLDSFIASEGNGDRQKDRKN
jgi:hypothetical protein